VLSLSVITACSGDDSKIQELEYEIESLRNEQLRLEDEAERLRSEHSRLEDEAATLEEVIASLEMAAYTPIDTGEHAHILRDCVEDCIELDLPELWAEISGVASFTLAYNPEQAIDNTQIRVFENGNANIRLFPDGTFIANLFHNTKITGAYTEMSDGQEIAVLFTYSGINNLSHGVSAFEATGLVTVVGGIVDDILTIPEDWDDGHGHGIDFVFRPYPLVFMGENGQRIILHGDNTFEANFANDVRVLGFYGIRATSITFVPGSPTFDGHGMPVGTFLLGGLRMCGDDFADNHTHDSDDDCEYVECELDDCDAEGHAH